MVDEARRIGGESASRQPAMLAAYCDRGQLLLSLERHAEAKEEFQRVVDLADAAQSDVWYVLMSKEELAKLVTQPTADATDAEPPATPAAP